MKQEFGTPLSRTATGATAAYATASGVANQRYYITDISVSSDLATGAIFQVRDGATPIWQGIIITPGIPYDHTFSEPLRLTSGATATVTINGTAQAVANFSGFYNNS